MIRCVYCDRLCVKKIQHKTFYYCRDYPDRLRNVNRVKKEVWLK